MDGCRFYACARGLFCLIWGVTMRRREFIGAAACALPLFNIGCAGFGRSRARCVAAGDRIRVGLIGCGAQMTGLIRRMGGAANVKVVALVDPDPMGIVRVKKSAVDFYGGFDFTGAWEGVDYREMFEAVGDSLDAVFIATPNHHHALPALMAVRRGIHLYLEKPFALTMEEVNLLEAEAKKTGVVTQVGNYGHSTTAMKMCVDAVRRGVIGEVREVYSYSDRCNSNDFRPHGGTLPKGMDWDLWCGPAPRCEYYGRYGGADGRERTGIHPHDWHSWIGYGNGSIGNMGTHIMDAPFWALDLGAVAPDRVEVKDVAWGAEGAWARRDTIDFHFPARNNLPPITLHWHDGLKDGVPLKMPFVEGHNNIAQKREYLNFPSELVELEKRYRLERAPLAFMGSVFIGSKGAIWHCFHSSLRFFPKGIGRDFIKNKVAYQADEHVMEFLNAIRERREANTCFDYSVPLARVLMLGNATARSGKGVYSWNGTKFTTGVKANEFLATAYRPGWELA